MGGSCPSVPLPRCSLLMDGEEQLIDWILQGFDHLKSGNPLKT